MARRRQNPRHPAALQAEVRERLRAEGKIDQHGNRIKTNEPQKIPPPPPKAAPASAMLTTAGTAETKPAPTVSDRPKLSSREKLETLPDAEIIAKASTLGMNTEGASRDDLINSLLEAGAEG